MKPSQKQVSRLKNIQNKKVSSKKSLKILKSLSKIKSLSKTKPKTKSTKSKIKTSKSSNVINIKENEYLILYNINLKYPTLVIEPINSNTGNTLAGEKIDRTQFRDPFLPSSNIDESKQHSWSTYLNSMFLGFSPGHNAPAGNHKTNQSTYLKTFELTNMCPQEMVFNSGLWVVFENWTKSLVNFKDLYDIHVITGSSPSYINKQIPTLPEKYFYSLFDGNNLISEQSIIEYQKCSKQIIKVPKSMFKIVVCRHRNIDPETILYIILDANNVPFYFKEGSLPVIDKKGKDKMKMKLKPFSITINKFESIYKIKFTNILNQVYSRYQRKYKLEFLTNHIYCIYSFPFLIELQMKKSYWYGQLIYAKNMEELENRWNELQAYEDRFRDLQYHRQYYLLRKVMLSNVNKK